MDSEIEELPTDYVRGLDFKIVKTSKGGYADYSTSTWARRERALSEAEQAAIQQYGLHNLKDFLPKKPTDVELKVIKEMFEASVDGEAFDMDRWGQYYKPSGMSGGGNGGGNAQASTPARPAPAPQAQSTDEDDAPFETAASAPVSTPAPAAGGDAGSRAADIIAMIRNRQKQ
jgi:hypothetical protein